MPWLTAPQALQLLRVRPQTLYANVSRKRIRAKPDPQDSRRSLYLEADVRQMARQQGRQRKAAAVAAGTLEWGIRYCHRRCPRSSRGGCTTVVSMR